MMKIVENNLSVFVLFGFFGLIGLINYSVDSTYKVFLPIEYYLTPDTPDSYSSQEKELISKACREYIYRWQSDHKRPIPAYTIRVVRSPFTSENGDTLWGLHQSGLRRITVYVGSNYEIPALYHEFCHCIDTGNDHDDPRWPQWRARQQELARMILILRGNG